MDQQHFVYIMTNTWNTVLYIGMSSGLSWRVEAHKLKLVEGFTKKYNLTKFVYYEVCESYEQALSREKSLKGLLRRKKQALVSSKNPEWRDLSDELE
jgi:putative endonuclease